MLSLEQNIERVKVKSEINFKNTMLSLEPSFCACLKHKVPDFKNTMLSLEPLEFPCLCLRVDGFQKHHVKFRTRRYMTHQQNQPRISKTPC